MEGLLKRVESTAHGASRAKSLQLSHLIARRILGRDSVALCVTDEEIEAPGKKAKNFWNLKPNLPAPIPDPSSHTPDCLKPPWTFKYQGRRVSWTFESLKKKVQQGCFSEFR